MMSVTKASQEMWGMRGNLLRTETEPILAKDVYLPEMKIHTQSAQMVLEKV